MCSSSTQLHWLSSLALSCESCWEDGGVESVETLHFSCSEGPPSSNALPISFRFIDFALWGQTDKKKEYHSLFRTHSCMILTNTTLMKGKVMIRGWNMYEKWTAWHIHTYDVVTKEKALQQIRSTASQKPYGRCNQYHSAKLKLSRHRWRSSN